MRFALLPHEEIEARKASLLELVRSFAPSAQPRRLEHWAGCLATASSVGSICDDREQRFSGAKAARIRLLNLAERVRGVEDEIEKLTRDARWSLDQIGKENDEHSKAIARGQVQLDDEAQGDLVNAIEWLTFVAPVRGFELEDPSFKAVRLAKRTPMPEDVVTSALRLPPVDEMHDVILPRFRAALQAGAKLLKERPTTSEGPVRKHAAMVTDMAARMYEEIVGVKPGQSKRFIDFLGRLFHLVGIEERPRSQAKLLQTLLRESKRRPTDSVEFIWKR